MEDGDDFEFVDNDRTVFDEVDEDEIFGRDELELGAISNLNKEMKEVQDLKHRLQSQCSETTKLMHKLKAQHLTNNQLQSQLKQELKEVHDLKASLTSQQSEFSAQKVELSKLLESMACAPTNIAKGQHLVGELRKFYSETASIEEEVTKLKSMRAQQEELIKECKINIETMASNQRDCLVALEDSAKSFECKECGTDIALKEDIESKCYQVGQGQFTEKKRGYLFQNAVNTVLGATKTENFTTGSYQISWVSCKKCSAQMGWKYISADNPNNTTKVGKYCLARYSLTSPEDRTTKK